MILYFAFSIVVLQHHKHNTLITKGHSDQVIFLKILLKRCYFVPKHLHQINLKTSGFYFIVLGSIVNHYFGAVFADQHLKFGRRKQAFAVTFDG